MSYDRYIHGDHLPEAMELEEFEEPPRLARIQVVCPRPSCRRAYWVLTDFYSQESPGYCDYCAVGRTESTHKELRASRMREKHQAGIQ